MQAMGRVQNFLGWELVHVPLDSGQRPKGGFAWRFSVADRNQMKRDGGTMNLSYGQPCAVMVSVSITSPRVCVR